jgi:XapX domain-containing protein
MLKPILGILLGLLIGVFCRFFEIPLPGPPAILGAFLAVAMATGYTLTDRMLTRGKPPIAAVTGAPAAEPSATPHE